jgi:hypothetical protein
MNKLGDKLHTYMGDFAKPITALLVVISLTLLTSNIISGQLFLSARIGNQGKVKVIDVGVYWDQNCTNAVTIINWGTLAPGSTKNITVFIRNEGNEVITLSLATENWEPQNASRFITLNWDYDGEALNSYEIIQVTLSLSVAIATEGIENFSFDIVIGAVGSE